MTTNHPVRAAVALGAALFLSTALVAPSFASAGTVRAQGVAASATSAIDWLEKELTASNHRFQVTSTFNGETSTFDDLGLTIDALLAVASAGRNADTEAKAASDYVVAHTADYVGAGTERYAGPLGKLMVMAQARGLDTTSVGGLNLENEVRARLQPNGRFTDNSEFGDFSNGVGQALDMVALARTTNTIPASSVTWLLAQQCANGGFRTDYAEGVACTDNADANADGTSFALFALKRATLTQAQDAKIDDALDYLLSLEADGTNLIGNANSSGLAASALRSFGLVPDANDVAAGVAALQLTAGPDKGAIALTKADKDATGSGAISDSKRPAYQRTTPQAVMALGLPSYIDRGTIAPVEPTARIALSPSTAKAGDSITVTGGGFEAGESIAGVVQSDPVSVGSTTSDAAGEYVFTFTLPSSDDEGSHTVQLTGASSGLVLSAPLTVTAAQVATT
ncbi:MAG: hypothetical protein H0U92_07210, partial [Actinobacteria bacterium]|nr:hypothetical protein [Actinomycetota bacterium]